MRAALTYFKFRILRRPLVEFAPGKHLIGIDVVLARDQRNGCAGNQRLFDDSALEADRMMAVAAALCRARRGLNDCVHDEICWHKLVVPSVSIMDKLGGVEQTVLLHRLRYNRLHGNSR